MNWPIMRSPWWGWLVAVGVGATTAATTMPEYNVVGADIATIRNDLSSGRVTASELIRAYTTRIDEVDRAGPALHAVVLVNPEAAAQADASDRRRRAGERLGALDGVPILIKDNIEVAGSMPTTAGSLALAANVSGHDAPLVARLRAAGAVILGKTNLSEWANYRSSQSISGWSGVGGLTRNPWALDRTACGSSSGSAAAVAASLAPAAVGTETDGSITCPASMTGLVGLKPTVGLISRSRVVPISSSQDTAGPMTRTVADAALLVSIMAGVDPSDPATHDTDAHLPGRDLVTTTLAGERIGVARFLTGHHEATDRLFERALEVFRRAGAVLVNLPNGPDLDAIGSLETVVLTTEFKVALNNYLATTPRSVTSRTLSQVIAFNDAHKDREMGLFGQDLMLKADATAGLGDTGYLRARAEAKRMAGLEGIDRLLTQYDLATIVAPTGGPAWVIDLIDGDHDGFSASGLPAVAGYPHLTVPMGTVGGLPVGLSLIGPAWSEQRLLSLGNAFESHLGLVQAPRYAASASVDPILTRPVAPWGGSR